MDAKAWNLRYGASELVWSAEPNRFVADIVVGWRPGTALDLACGEGRNAIWLTQQGWTVTGVDFSQVAIDKARTLAQDQLPPSQRDATEWICADATHPLNDSRSYDLVLMCYLQLPPEPLRQVLDTAVAALSPDGALLIIAHALDNLEHGVGGPQDPAVLPTAQQMSDALLAASSELTIERAGNVARPVDTDAGPRDAIDLVVVARRQSA